MSSLSVSRIACIGGGLIGAGWAAHFLRAGLQVVVQDPAADRESFLNSYLDRVWPTLAAMGLAPGASRDRLSFTTDLERALDGTDFVQESAVEDRAAKVRLLSEIDMRLPAGVVIASDRKSVV